LAKAKFFTIAFVKEFFKSSVTIVAQQQNDFPTVCSQLSSPAEFTSLEEDLSYQAVSSECPLRIPTGYAPYFYSSILLQSV
jgi:hypothetical protein